MSLMLKKKIDVSLRSPPKLQEKKKSLIFIIISLDVKKKRPHVKEVRQYIMLFNACQGFEVFSVNS